MKEYADPVIDWLDAGRGILVQRLFRDVSSSFSTIHSLISLLSLAPNYPTAHTPRICPSSNRIFHESVWSTIPPSATMSIKVRFPPLSLTPLLPLTTHTHTFFPANGIPSKAGPMIPQTKLY